MTDDDLVALERAGWDALCSDRGAEHYREHLAAGARMAFPFGVLDRAQSLEAIAAAAPWARYAMDDARVVRLGADAAVVVYAVTAQRSGEPPFRGVLSSTFMRQGDAWRLAFHQQSPSAQGG
jgi:hypothetical protein